MNQSVYLYVIRVLEHCSNAFSLQKVLEVSALFPDAGNGDCQWASGSCSLTHEVQLPTVGVKPEGGLWKIRISLRS